LQAIAYGTVAYFIATLFKQTGISIVMFFVYKAIVESIIDWKILTGSSGDYLPMNLFSGLTPTPFAKAAKAALDVQAFSIQSPMLELLSLLYIIIIIGGIYFLITKRDL
jgi:hypothetical protein